MKRTIVIDTGPTENFIKKYWVYGLLILALILLWKFYSNKTERLDSQISDLKKDNIELAKNDSALVDSLNRMREVRILIQEEKKVLRQEIAQIRAERDKFKKEKDAKKVVVADFTDPELVQFFADYYFRRFGKY